MQENEQLMAMARDLLRANGGYETQVIRIPGPMGMETRQAYRERHNKIIALMNPDLVLQLEQIGAFTADGMLQE